MDRRTDFNHLAVGKPARPALTAFFDELEPVPLSLLQGLWRGGAWDTGSVFYRLLRLSGWYGKLFRDAEDVEALLFRRPPHLVGQIHYILMSLWRTPEVPRTVRGPFGKARLREILFRGKVSTAMCYNYLPIIDHFRLIDQYTVMGLMDYKGRADGELFFWLERDQ